MKGLDNPADVLSRQPLDDANSEIYNESELTESYINSIVANAIPKEVTLSEVIKSSREDNTIQRVIKCLANHQWPRKDPAIKPYFMIRNKLAFKGCILLKESDYYTF